MDRVLGLAHADVQAGVGVAETSAGMSRQGLYNVLEDLTGAGLIRRIEPAGSPTRYELRVGDNHHHLVCRQCGPIEDVDCATGVALCLEPVGRTGFAIEEAEITWWGLCVRCQREAPQ
ncbi:Fur family transcriptional regulator [Streptomyces niveus]